MTWLIIVLVVVLVAGGATLWQVRRQRDTPSDPPRRAVRPDDIRSGVEHQAMMGDRLRNRYRNDH